MAHDPFPPRKPITNPEQPKLPPACVPADLAAAITSALAHRAALEAAGRSSECMEPVWKLAAQICGRFPCLAAEPGVVGIRLSELPPETPPPRVWASIRTAAKADEWEYARDHHHCIRVGDWSGWAA